MFTQTTTDPHPGSLVHPLNVFINKTAFQSDAYRPLANRRGVTVPRVVWSWRYGLGYGRRGGGVQSNYFPVNRLTDACENITFPQLLLQAVIKYCTLGKKVQHRDIPILQLYSTSVLKRSARWMVFISFTIVCSPCLEKKSWF